MAPSIPYYNQSGPFWDFVADLERQGGSHPIFAGRGPNREAGEQGGPAFPWRWAPHQYAQYFNRGPPPPPAADHEDVAGDIPDPPVPMPEVGEKSDPETAGEESAENGEKGKKGKKGCKGPRGEKGARGCGPNMRGRGGCGARGRGGPFGPFGPRGGRPFGGPGGPFNLGALAQFFQEQALGGGADREASGDASRDFKPLIDVFDTESSFIVHVSLPGAKKEDVGVSWDAEKSELNIAGVVHRPGDEDLLKTLALDERQVGAFERKVRLGSRANPAQVDVEAISAKLEDGILRIEVPKEDRDYVDVKKVSIE